MNQAEVLKRLREYQLKNDCTIEFFCEDCWEAEGLKEKIADEDGRTVSPGATGAYEPDGSYEDIPLEDWELDKEIVKFVITARRQYQWTEVDLDYVDGLLSHNPRVEIQPPDVEANHLTSDEAAKILLNKEDFAEEYIQLAEYVRNGLKVKYIETEEGVFALAKDHWHTGDILTVVLD